MVKIAVAGGSGQLGREVIDSLLATNKHEITIFSRTERSGTEDLAGVKWRIVDYDSRHDLVEALRGTHTLLSFLQLLSDPEARAQKTLVDAAIAAGVKRFIPSEYGSASMAHMFWSAGKESTRSYLKEVNKQKKPGLFLDYLAYPYQTAKHIEPLQSIFDIQNCRAIVVDGHEDAIMTLTAVSDVATLIARIVEHEDEWPEIGGIKGNRMTFRQIIEAGERVRGQKFAIEKVKMQDLKAGKLTTSWNLQVKHHAVSEQDDVNFATVVPIGILISSTQGAWDVSDELNHLFPDHTFQEMEEFLGRVWNDKA